MAGNQESLVEFDYYIPPDVNLNQDGSIPSNDWDKVYQFTDGLNQFLMSFTGLGMPNIEYITQRGPYQHGRTVLDYRLLPRTIQLVHRRNACSRTEWWEARTDIMNKLRINRQLANTFRPGRLRKIRPDDSIIDIEAFIQFGPMFQARIPDRWDEWSFTESIRFICNDPTFFDPALQTVTWDLDAIDGLIFFESPDWEEHLIFPVVFGGDGAISGFQAITYEGTWQSFPTIEFTGPLGSPMVENTTIGEKIELTYSIAAGEIVTINLAFGNKTVSNNFGVNLIGTVTSDSDLATFHIAPDPEAVGGVNIFSSSGLSGVLDSTEVSIKYNTRYIGI